MNYKEIIESIAKKHNTTAQEVDKEIRMAIKSAGLDTEPEKFIETLGIITEIETLRKTDMP